MHKNKMQPPGMKPQNMTKTVGRILSYLKEYRWRFIAVLVCILMAAATSVASSLFLEPLIDDYIVPLTKTAHPNFGPLAAKILQVAGFYGIGVITTYAYNRIMVNVTQGTLRNLRVEMFEKMETLPIKYFDTNAHGDICQRIRMILIHCGR